MGFLSPSEKQLYKDTINEWSIDDANLQPLIWRRQTMGLNEYGEDEGFLTEDINLLGLIQYNYFRTWPLNAQSSSGELDKESTLVLLNKQYLNDLGYLNADGYFTYDPGLDKFLLDGELYKPFGDTPLSQAFDEALHIMIILKREETLTGDSIH